MYKASTGSADSDEKTFYALKEVPRVTDLGAEASAYFGIDPARSPHLSLLVDVARAEKDGRPLLVLPWAEDRDMHAWLQRAKPMRGNAALCIAECAKEGRCLAVLAVQPVVPPLLDIAHNGKGQAQKNAAIALGRLAKNPRCLQAIRDNHGIDILARAMKGSFGNMGLG